MFSKITKTISSASNSYNKQPSLLLGRHLSRATVSSLAQTLLCKSPVVPLQTPTVMPKRTMLADDKQRQTDQSNSPSQSPQAHVLGFNKRQAGHGLSPSIRDFSTIATHIRPFSTHRESQAVMDKFIFKGISSEDDVKIKKSMQTFLETNSVSSLKQKSPEDLLLQDIASILSSDMIDSIVVKGQPNGIYGAQYNNMNRVMTIYTNSDDVQADKVTLYALHEATHALQQQVFLCKSDDPDFDDSANFLKENTALHSALNKDAETSNVVKLTKELIDCEYWLEEDREVHPALIEKLYLMQCMEPEERKAIKE